MTPLIAYSMLFFLTFAFVAGVAGMAYLWVERKRKRDSPEPNILQGEELSTFDALAALLARMRFVPRLQKLLDESDAPWSVGRVVLMMAVGGLLTLVVALNYDFIPRIAAVALAGVGAWLPILRLNQLRAARLAAVEEQLPEALDYISRAMIAGNSLPLALELLSDEIGDPLAPELRKTIDEYNLGTTMEGALAKLAERLPCVDIRFFVSAIMTQQRTGGSLHELLDNLADTIRERATLKGQVKSLTANGRMTAIILSLLPVFIAGVMLFINREYFMMLAGNRLGQTLLFMGACSEIAAFFVIRKIADIEV